MAKKLQIYKCVLCGNIVEVLEGKAGQLVCCGQPMNLLTVNTVDADKEKHVPVIEKTPAGFQITVGRVLHPSFKEHYIEWIELLADGKSYRHFLKPGDRPSAIFNVPAEIKKITARIYCNLHGLWQA